MKIYGMQKLTLIDYPGKVAATVFLGGCNFRCPFCHNASLVTSINGDAALEAENIIPLLKKRIGVLDGICITGGEPLLYDETIDFIRTIKNLGYSVKLDTNGTFPERLEKLISENLVDYVAMDIKNCIEHYGETVGVKGFDVSPVLKSAMLLKNSGIDYEFRTTVVKELHKKEDFYKMAEDFPAPKNWYLQTFTDSGDCIKQGLSAYNKEEMAELKDILLSKNINAILREI